jgi:hypothetical protein
MEQVENFKSNFRSMSDGELHAQMHQYVAHSEMHLAAKLLLEERKNKKEKQRFHLVFWPSLIAATIAVLSFIL